MNRFSNVLALKNSIYRYEVTQYSYNTASYLLQINNAFKLLSANVPSRYQIFGLLSVQSGISIIIVL